MCVGSEIFELANNMKITSAEFTQSIPDLKKLPSKKLNLPQVVFFGRSNVGKSSLINSLVAKKKLVKTSSSPGKTTFFNFFLINRSFFIIDSPGYGFAKVPQKVKKEWENQFRILLSKLENLKLVVHLLDIRHLSSELDRYYHQIIQHGTATYCIVATKADCLSKNKQKTQLKKLEKELNHEILPYSIKDPQTREDLLKGIATALK